MEKAEVKFHKSPKHNKKGVELSDHVKEILKRAKAEYEEKVKQEFGSENQGPSDSSVAPEGCGVDPYRDCWCVQTCGGWMDTQCL